MQQGILRSCKTEKIQLWSFTTTRERWSYNKGSKGDDEHSNRFLQGITYNRTFLDGNGAQKTRTISPRVTDEMKRVLRQPFSLEEVDGAITALPKLSCPCEDGLSPLFFKKYWDVIKHLVYEGFQEIVDKGALPQRFGGGLVFLVPQ